MAPTEESILRGFLLPSAPLAAGLPFEQFKGFFPRPLQSNPKLEELYRELQQQRAIDIDDVKRNIDTEVKNGDQQRREMIRARKKSQDSASKGVDRQELLKEAQVGDPSAALSLRELIPNQLLNRQPEKSLNQPHTLENILPAMEQACESIEAEIEAMEKESEEVLADIKSTIGDLSDLRYGKFSRVSDNSSDLNEEVIQGLARIGELCRDGEKG